MTAELNHFPRWWIVAIGLGVSAWSAVAGSPWQDRTAPMGVAFSHRQGSRSLYLPETMGAGVAVLDFDGDGREDLFFVQGSGRNNGSDPVDRPRCALWRSRPDGCFEDATEASGAGLGLWGMGCMAADVDSDGDPDLVVTGYADRPALLENQGDGTFRVRPGALGDQASWFTGVSGLDFDRDGFLDVYLCGYMDFPASRLIAAPRMVDIQGTPQPDTLSPYIGSSVSGRLLRNLGTGRTPEATFEDVTVQTGAGDPRGKGFAAVAVDVDRDGWQDLFIANDVTPCALLMNQQGKSFRDVGTTAWIADIRGSMGLAAADYNHDGSPDLIVTRWVQEDHALYHNTLKARRRAAEAGTVTFVERAQGAGIAPLCAGMVGWSVGWPDLDLDGWEDLVVVNGHTYQDPAVPGTLVGQPLSVLLSDGRAGFRATPGPPGPEAVLRVGRGGAFADLDGNGGVDLVTTTNNGPAALLMHQGPTWPPASGHHWISLDLVGTVSLRSAVGSRVQIAMTPRPATIDVTLGGGYLSSSSSMVHLGLGTRTETDVEVLWPDGTRQFWPKLAADRRHRLVQRARD